MPLPDTVVDFWRLVFDYKCATIILLEEVDAEVIKIHLDQNMVKLLQLVCKVYVCRLN